MRIARARELTSDRRARERETERERGDASTIETDNKLHWRRKRDSIYQSTKSTSKL